MVYFGFLYSPAYPLGTRLGITVFWQPAVIQDLFCTTLARRCIVITQWLILWFYTQHVYFASLDIVSVTTKLNGLFISLAYLGVPRTLWRKKRRKVRRKRRRRIQIVRRKKWRNAIPAVAGKQLYFTSSNIFRYYSRYRHSSVLDPYFNATGILRQSHRAFKPTKFGTSSKFFTYFGRFNTRLNKIHQDLVLRFISGFYKSIVIKEHKNYFGPRRKLKKKFFVFRRCVSRRNLSVVFTMKFDIKRYRAQWLARFLAKRRRFF